MHTQFYIPQVLITNHKEVRGQGDSYKVIEEGYGIYPMDEEIQVKKSEDGRPYAIGKINKLEWENNQTILTFSLVKLLGVN
ncbi:DUF2584 family protein [Bacillus sp. FJAT-44742]|uniref:DUF2584 family protein n=1 Tax=Bacillus sp. FJAT-44742 TaxID=2014005 RepID=UPI000C24F120|nr:DUF2584 family protein [Bacillus sp. FJAT-44742]